MSIKKPFFLGILSSAFFAFTFIFNRSMNLSGGYWMWTASLRYIFILPMLLLLLIKGNRIKKVIAHITSKPAEWFLWSTVGFGLFYTGISLSSLFAESWFTVSLWQLTIVAGVLLTPLFGKKIPVSNLLFAVLIVFGVFLLELPHILLLQQTKSDASALLVSIFSMLMAAFAYPLGNRKMMQLSSNSLTTLERVFGMTLCSMPYWLVMAAIAYSRSGLPSQGQLLQSFAVALLSGVIATLLFFKATDLVKDNPAQLAVVEATIAGEVPFTLLGGLLFLHDPLPTPSGFAGIIIIILGMIGTSFVGKQK